MIIHRLASSHRSVCAHSLSFASAPSLPLTHLSHLCAQAHDRIALHHMSARTRNISRVRQSLLRRITLRGEWAPPRLPRQWAGSHCSCWRLHHGACCWWRQRQRGDTIGAGCRGVCCCRVDRGLMPCAVRRIGRQAFLVPRRRVHFSDAAAFRAALGHCFS